jgi:hypothetical protein
MKWLVTFALLATTLCAHAEHGAHEAKLTNESKARLASDLGEALHRHRITQQQYDQSIIWVNASPCDGVDRSLNAQRKAQLEVAIAKEHGRQTVKVFDSFKSDGWFILFTDASEGDEPYFFYSKDPLLGGHPVTAWSGAATIFETSDMEKWVKENVPGIPIRLASCFAWHVTLRPE